MEAQVREISICCMLALQMEGAQNPRNVGSFQKVEKARKPIHPRAPRWQAAHHHVDFVQKDPFCGLLPLELLDNKHVLF